MSMAEMAAVSARPPSKYWLLSARASAAAKSAVRLWRAAGESEPSALTHLLPQGSDAHAVLPDQELLVVIHGAYDSQLASR